jgi:eukaryotic-like serine/threonine-protein kinase
VEPDRWILVKDRFAELLAIPSAGRAHRLSQIEAEDAELATELRRLLAADRSAIRLLGRIDHGERAVDPAWLDRASPDPLGLIGTTVSHFRVHEVIDAGGMGVVYRAEDVALGRPVALKFLLPQLDLDDDAKQRFLHEARAVSMLDHPHICTVHEVGETEAGQLFLAMAFYRGETVRQRLARDGPLPIDEARELTGQVLSALGVAHDAGILHRDLKPANLMITEAGLIKVLDFGIAKARDLNLTGSGLLPGTAGYMSPQQLRNEPADERSDLWSVGAVLYEMLTGEAPFGTGHSLSTLYRVLFERPTPPRRIRPEIPPELERLVLRLLSGAPARRPIDAKAAYRVLRGAGRASASTAEPSLGAGARSRRPIRWLVRNPVLAAAFAAAVTGLLILGGADPLAQLRGAAFPGSGRTETPAAVVLAEFDSPTGDWALASMATEVFRIDLRSSPAFDLLDPVRVREAMIRMGHAHDTRPDGEIAREVAVREGASAVIEGAITRTGTAYHVSVRLVAAENGALLAAYRQVARDSTTLLSAIDILSRRLRRRIGEPVRTLSANPGLEQVTTSSLDALRKYSRAKEVFWSAGDHANAIGLLQEAIALDSTFAMARWALVGILADLADEPTQRTEMLAHAYRYRERLPNRERYHLRSYYYAIVAWEIDRAIAVTEQLLETYPNDEFGLHLLSRLYQAKGDYQRAESHIEAALAINPGRFVWLANLAVFQFNQGKFEAASRTFQRLEAVSSTHPLVTFHSILRRAALGDFDAAERQAINPSLHHSGDVITKALIAQPFTYLAAVRGRFQDAEHRLRLGSDLAVQRGSANSEVLNTIDLVHLKVGAGYPPRTELRRAESLLGEQKLITIPVYDRPYPELAVLYARAGYPDEAREIVAEWESVAPLDLRRIQYHRPSRLLLGRVLPWVLGEIDMAEGNPQAAVQRFREANAQSGCIICALPHLGRAYELAGEPDSAVIVYDRFLTEPSIYRLYYDAEWRAFVLERLARLHHARGDRARAARYYAEFIELWRDADPPFQSRVTEARRRLSEVQYQ